MNFLLAIFLGAVQGLTEFLPVSSTGHLIIFEHLFNISQRDFGLAFDASLHLGTLVAVLLFFYKDYWQAATKGSLFLKLIIGTIPAVFFGVIFESIVETTLRQLWIVGLALIVFSVVMILAEKFGQQTKKKENLSLTGSLVVGFFQALALIPGISRSGATISAGLFLKMTRVESARFAFLLSGPIIAGAGLKKFSQATSQLQTADLGFFTIGIISSAVFGYLTIKYFLRYLSTKNLYPFVVYRVILGLVLIFASLKS